MTEKESIVPEFFGAIDREGKRPDGRISSEYPAWYGKKRLEIQKQEIADDERRLEWFPQMRDMGTMKLEEQKIKTKKEHLSMLEYIPDISKIKDYLAKLRDKIGKLIRDEMHDPRTDMMKGLANVHSVHAKMNEYTWGDATGINIRGVEGAILQKMNVFHRGGKFKGKDLVKVYRMCSVLLGEDPSDERLRRDYAYGTYREDVPFDRLVKEARV